MTAVIDTAYNPHREFTPITEAELDRWITELNSGDHNQTDGQLREVQDHWDGDTYVSTPAYCCLGLKCEIEGFDLDATWRIWEAWDGEKRTLTYGEHGGLDGGDPHDLGADEYTGPLPAPLTGLSYRTRSALARANDGGSHTFADIAAALNLYRSDLLAGRDLGFDGVDLVVMEGHL